MNLSLDKGDQGQFPKTGPGIFYDHLNEQRGGLKCKTSSLYSLCVNERMNHKPTQYLK